MVRQPGGPGELAKAPAQRWFADGGLFIGQITSYLTTEQVVIPPSEGRAKPIGSAGDAPRAPSSRAVSYRSVIRIIEVQMAGPEDGQDGNAVRRCRHFAAG